MKEQGKNTPDLTNEEEIGSLPEKELRVMIIKMIQNLGKRMEKIQETLNKYLENLKSKQTVMNSTINEIKNSLEGINSRIPEAKQWISNLEEKIVEITTAEENKELKELSRVSETSGTTLNAPTFELEGSQKKKRKRKGLRKYFKRLYWKTSLIWERKQSIKSRKHRESHTG